MAELITIVVAIALAFVAWKVLMGLVKFGAMIVIGLGALYFLTQGGVG
ncbi:hypothetical protein [Altererythrobacter sp. MTPC7]|nr:hypothetical protein PF049_09565 [Erythrobacteraceae bacterium WH01K]